MILMFTRFFITFRLGYHLLFPVRWVSRAVLKFYWFKIENKQIVAIIISKKSKFNDVLFEFEYFNFYLNIMHS